MRPHGTVRWAALLPRYSTPLTHWPRQLSSLVCDPVRQISCLYRCFRGLQLVPPPHSRGCGSTSAVGRTYLHPTPKLGQRSSAAVRREGSSPLWHTQGTEPLHTLFSPPQFCTRPNVTYAYTEEEIQYHLSSSRTSVLNVSRPSLLTSLRTFLVVLAAAQGS